MWIRVCMYTIVGDMYNDDEENGAGQEQMINISDNNLHFDESENYGSGNRSRIAGRRK